MCACGLWADAGRYDASLRPSKCKTIRSKSRPKHPPGLISFGLASRTNLFSAQYSTHFPRWSNHSSVNYGGEKTHPTGGSHMCAPGTSQQTWSTAGINQLPAAERLQAPRPSFSDTLVDRLCPSLLSHGLSSQAIQSLPNCKMRSVSNFYVALAMAALGEALPQTTAPPSSADPVPLAHSPVQSGITDKCM